jgi:hypothetical protein
MYLGNVLLIGHPSLTCPASPGGAFLGKGATVTAQDALKAAQRIEQEHRGWVQQYGYGQDERLQPAPG